MAPQAVVVNLLPHSSHLRYSLGRHQQHDPRSRGFRFRTAAPVAHKTVYHPTTPVILNQKSVGACVGFTGADLLNTAAFAAVRKSFNHSRLYQNRDGLDFYHLASAADAIPGTYPPDDTGSSGIGLAKAFTRLGLIDHYTHAFGFDHFRDAIAVKPVAVGTLWTQTMFTPDADGIVTVGSLADDNIAGGHEYMVRGIDYEKQIVWARNHWAKSWGKAGEFGVRFDDFEQLLENGGDVTVLHGAGTR
jgi:hypothetical protein